MADRVGQHLGNYQLIRLIGRGGFAEVYLGTHIYLDMPAAIKVLHAQLARDDADQFRSEARIIARLVHPNIVRVLEFGIEGATPFLVVDYASNGTLRKLYPRGTKLPLATVVSHISQVADALQYAHDQKIVHRDVKPENMLLGRRYEVLLSDFGIALVAQSTRRQSAENMQDLAGTIAYMAPEQIQSRAVPASDQYSLAVVAYEWLGGERPFQGSFTEIAIKHTLVVPPPLGEKLPDLPVEVEAVIMKALSKEPEERFPTVKAFAVALEQAWRETLAITSLNEGGSFINPSTSGLTPLLSDQGGTPTALLPSPEQRFSSSLLLSGASPPDEDQPSSRTMPLPDDEPTAAFVETLSTPTPTDPGEHIDVEIPALPQPTASMQELAAILEQQATPVVPSSPAIVEEQPGEPKEPAISDQQHGISRRAALIGLASVLVLGAAGAASWLVYSEESRNASLQATPVSAMGSTLLSYKGHTDLVWSVAWSPGGDLLASAGSDRTVQVWKATDGTSVYTYTSHSDTVYGVTWSPDSKRIASASYDKTVQVWDAVDGYYPYTYNGHSSWVWCVAWSHNGKYIASAGSDKVVKVWDATSGDPVSNYHGHSGNIYGLAWSPDSKDLVSTSNDKTAREWEVLTGRDLFVYSPYGGTTIWAAAWSPDGTRIAVACDNKTVQVWDAVGGDHVYIYYGHSDFVYTVAWSPDGTRIASAGDDKTVQVWDSVDGGHPYTYNGHTASVRSLAWSPDGTRIASASWDKTVQVWKAK
jgi:serine/threonine protein kinase